MGKQENISEVKSLLRMTLHISPYIPDYATITAPLWQLTKNKELHGMGQRANDALDKLSKTL